MAEGVTSAKPLAINMREVYTKPVEVPEVYVYGLGTKQWEYRVEKLEVKKWPREM
jgi:hypothetical protein